MHSQILAKEVTLAPTAPRISPTAPAPIAVSPSPLGVKALLMPYSNYMGSVQDGMDFNPVTTLDKVEWSGYLLTSAVLVYGGAAWTSSGASALLVQDLSNHQ